MNIKQLYEKYDVMPQLVEHQLRVGVVGQIVAENWRDGCDVGLATKLGLLHDMGNIVKLDLSDEAQRVSVFGKVDNLSHWQKVQKKYWEQYGKDAHVATKEILSDAGLGEMNSYMDEEGELYVGEASREKLETANVESIILMYADFRVKPEGVVSYQDRVDDLYTRYRSKSPTWYEWAIGFEKWMQEQVAVDLTTIDEALTRVRWDELLQIRI